jgi:proteic killer suppression protein
MIISFKGQLAADLFFDRTTAAVRRFRPELRAVAARKLQYLNAATRLDDLKVPPGNRLDALKGDLKGFHSQSHQLAMESGVSMESGRT